MQQRKTDTFTYELVRARRKSMAMKVEEDGKIVVRVPYRLPAEHADKFVECHKEWIVARRHDYETMKLLKPSYTDEEKEQYRQAARIVLDTKCRRFAERMGVTYGRISIKEQKTRWGSCSVAGNLNFNWKLVLMPEKIQDYLVVHELAHRKEMNHSERFWAVVEEFIPDYRERRKWLRIHGVEY